MRVLCFGDSNTWGDDPFGEGRLERRWPTFLQETQIGSTVIEEGLCGRTYVAVQADKPYRAGLPYFIPCVDSHDPLDYIFIMLGTNDLKAEFGLSGKQIFEHSLQYVTAVENLELLQKPKLIYIIPSYLGSGIEDVRPGQLPDGNTRLDELYNEFASSGLDYIDCRDLAVGEDELHLTVSSHEELAKRVVQKISELH